MDTNETLAYKIYEQYGQDAVFKAVNDGKLKVDSWEDCLPCEYLSPIYQNHCLVCGETVLSS